MTIINIHEAKTNFSKLIARTEQGEEIIIAKAGHPVARLIGYVETRSPRRGGQWKGLVKIRDDFDAPLPSEIEESFSGDHS